ncbi:SSX6, partial [Sigmodon hispidus]
SVCGVVSKDCLEYTNVFESFKDISKYFSEEEWAKLTKWQKSTYVYMKRNYIRMTDLGVIVNKPISWLHITLFKYGKDHLSNLKIVVHSLEKNKKNNEEFMWLEDHEQNGWSSHRRKEN